MKGELFVDTTRLSDSFIWQMELQLTKYSGSQPNEPKTIYLKENGFDKKKSRQIKYEPKFIGHTSIRLKAKIDGNNAPWSNSRM